MPRNDPLAAVRSAISRHPRLSRQAVAAVRMEDEILVLEGRVAGITAKRLVPRIAVESSGGLGVLDRLRIDPDKRRADADIAANVESRLAGDTLFGDYRVSAGASAVPKAAPGRTVGVTAAEGVVRLSGQVETLRHRRLAEVFAWWADGCADVDNRLAVTRAEMDSDDEITDVVRLVLDRDPQIDSGQLAVRTIDRTVRLKGRLPTADQKCRAERDAWYVAGVHDVDNRIRVLDHAQLDACADEASRESFPASDPPSMTPIIGIGGTARQGKTAP